MKIKRSKMRGRLLLSLLLLFILLPYPIECLTRFTVPESAQIGFRIGWISGKMEESVAPKYFVVFPDEQTSKFLKVDERTGEITTIAHLDYEKRSKFDIVAVRVEESGETIDILVEVDDENDNAPSFADQSVKLEISEFAQLGTSFALPTVTDGDGPKFDVHKFVILQGNVNNVFKLTSRKVNEQLQADLVVNGQLDREFRDKYELLIEAQDGGKPAKTGQLRCSIEIIDANDNAPVFSRSRYTASISANVSIGAHIITVTATDGDIGENSRISYEIKKTSSPSNSNFAISNSGVITTTSSLLPASTHDVIVVASDHGNPPLSSSAVVTISVMGSTLASPPLDIIWLVESNSAHLPENSTLGSIVARVSIAAPYRDTKLRLTGTTSLCPQQTDQSHVYLLLLCGILDRETTSEYHLKFLLEKDGQMIIEHPQLLTIGDINDNAPQWHSSQIHISLNRTQGGSRTLTAKDPDLGQNGWIRYSVLDTDLVSIDKETGRIFVPKTIDCNVGSELKFRVRAEDGGSPALSTDLQVVADLLDSESKPPQFERALWQVEIAEDTPVGTCLIKVVANNSQCGNSKRIRYSMQQGKDEYLSVDSMSGTICIQKSFDFEKGQSHQTTVIATNANSETSTSLISIRLQDVNDNWPIFYPNEYQLTIREGPKPSEPLLVVSASDLDSGRFGEMEYQILSESNSFSINSVTGEVFAKKDLTRGRFHLVVNAKDGGGQHSENPANIHITVVDRNQKTPEFSRSKYEIKTTEDILPGIAIGSVAAISEGKIKYSIYSGDPEHNFSIDEDTGKIYVTRYLDADVHDTVLLNVQAQLYSNPEYCNQTQVLILIEDHNDNAPVFLSNLVEISVREDVRTSEAFYIIGASDADKKKNGEIRYSIISSHPGSSIEIDGSSGQISTTSEFDYEAVRSYKIRIKASDLGIPSRSSNMTLFVHISDVNDNSPIFEKTAYFMEVSENAPAKTSVGKIAASDADSGDNGLISYRVTNGSEYFGIDEKLGVLYTKKSLDRETISHVDVTITAQDHGVPSRTSSVHARISVLDQNDNPPSCLSITPIVVPANAPHSTSIGTIVAADPDKGLNGSVLYRAQLQSQLFVVKSNGDVYLRRQLNATDEHHQRLSVIVSDQGSPRKSAVCHVSIRIAKGTSDIVLEEPVQRYLQIPAYCTPSKSCRLTVINATGVASWAIQSSEISNHFAIRQGVLSMLSQPTHRPPYTLVIVLSDKSDRQKSIHLRVVAPGEAQNHEEIIRISDQNSIGSKVGKLGEKSVDFFYRFATVENCPLELDQTAGVLYLAEGVRGAPRDANFSCFFEKFNTTDGSVDEMRVDLEITRSKSDKPQFDTRHLTVHVREDTPTGSILTTVNATANDDSSTPISYRFPSQIDTFAIDQFTGDITLVESLHWHVKSTYHLIVEAFTSGPGTTLLVTVAVEDVNDHAPFIVSQPTVILPANYRKGDVVHRVVAIDLDQESTISYSIQNYSEPVESLRMDTVTGEISYLSSDGLPETITVRAEDAKDPTKFDEQKVLIRRISNSTDQWHFFDLPKDVVVVEAGSPVAYEIKNADDVKLQMIPQSSQFFELQGSKILQKTVNVASGTYRITVVAQKEPDLIDYMLLEITIPPQYSEPPKISSTSCGMVTVEENVELKNFKRIMATGMTNSSRFRIQGAPSTFTIDPLTGQLSSTPLDRETSQEHLLVILLSDQNSHNDSCTVRVTIMDRNDNAPVFAPNSPEELSINKSSQLGDVLWKFQASDMDIGQHGKFSFEILEDPSKSLDLVPETGALVLRRCSSLESWNLKIRVVDYAGLESRRELKILNSMECGAPGPPEFLKQSYISSIDESLPRGQFIAKLESSGDSSGDAGITYSIVEGNLDSAFSIDPDGIIRSNLELDKEILDRYNLKVIGILAGGSPASQISTRVDVRVKNLNDNSPSFPALKPRRIPENLRPGSYVATVTARDVDQIGVLQYAMDHGPQNLFHLDRYTGVIHLNAPLDYETCKEHTLRIRVSDGTFSSQTNLTIFVSDVNDNAPRFSKNFYRITVSPTTLSPGLPFAKIEARDSDSNGDQKLIYSLSPESSSIFKISQDDGSVSMRVLPPAGEQYLVTVTATDAGVPSLATSVPVMVVIGDTVPTERPVFERQEFRFEVLENSKPGLQIGNLSGDTREFAYRIPDPEAAKLFHVDKFGRLFVTGPIDRETRSSYQFTVEIENEMTSTTKILAKIHVIVLDENDNSPVFSTSSGFFLQLKDSMTHGQTIGQILAHDLDSDENGRVSYRILSGNDLNIVTLNTDSGAIQMNEWNDAQLDEHPNATWQILVEARDHGHPYRSTVATITVSLKMSSWSGSAPFFVLPVYEIHVMENAKIGTIVQRVRASNRLGMENKGLLYSLKEHQGKLSIDVKTGEITLKSHLDWESEPLISMYLSVSDGNGRSAVVPLKIVVEPVDEFAPVFTKSEYTLQIPLSTSAGESVGQMQAIDEDGGTHGVVKYSITDRQSTVSIEEHTGIIRLQNSLSQRRNLTIEQITVVAYSSPNKRTKTTVNLEIGPFDVQPTLPKLLLHSKPVQIAAASLILLLLLLILVIIVCMCKSRRRRVEKPSEKANSEKKTSEPLAQPQFRKPTLQKQVYSVKTGEIRTLSGDVPNFTSHSMTSSVSTSSDALRGIRGSSRSQMDSGIIDPDNVSMNSSITDYLVSLGVNANPIPPRTRANATYDSLMNEYIYARVEDVLPPGPISLTTPNQHSLLRQPLSTAAAHRRPPPIVPSFEPLTEIFSEIVEMQKSDQKRKEYVQVEI